MLLSLLCFYSFTLIVLLEFHLTYTKDHFSKSLDLAFRMSRSVKAFPENVKPEVDKVLKKIKNIVSKDDKSRDAVKKQDVQIIENIRFPNKKLDAEEEIWQGVTSDGKLYVFSAFYEILDDRPSVRVLGINGNTYLPKPYCQFRFDSGEILTVKGRIWMLPDHHEKQ